MQVTETAAAGLKREYRVVVPATDLEAQVNERLDDLKGRVQLRGFRPGKVPVAHLKRIYGKSAMAEVIEAAVREANDKIVSDHGFKLATEPKVVLPSEEGRRRRRHRRQIRPRLHGRDGDRPADRAHRLQDHEARSAYVPTSLTRRSIRRCRRLPTRTVRSSPRPKAPINGDRVTISFQGTIGRPAVRRRLRRGCADSARLGALSSRASRITSSAPRRAKAGRSTSNSPRTIRRRPLPAKTRPLRSP